MAEKCIGPMSLDDAEDELARLMDESNAFHNGSFPVVGRLKTSYGYKKVIGVKSFDNKVYTRLDFDPEKGFHFNFTDDNTGENICILINDMNESQYKHYIDALCAGKSPIIPTKRRVQYIIDYKNYVDINGDAFRPIAGPDGPSLSEFVRLYLEEVKRIELEEMQEEQTNTNEEIFTK